MYTIQHITDKSRLRTYFQHDIGLHAYALGDLVPYMWAKSTYFAALDVQGQICGVMLVWRGVNPPVLLLFGQAQAAESLLQNTPARVFHMLPETLLPTFQQHYTTETVIALWRMVVTETTFIPPSGALDSVRRLHGGDLDNLRQLYSYGDGGPRQEEIDAFSAEQLEDGIFFGAFAGTELVAVAGSHFYAPPEHIGGIGYVYTRPSARGQGYGTQVTAAVTRTMFAAGVSDVVLNVARDNQAAIHTYSKLGFQTHTQIVEGYAFR